MGNCFGKFSGRELKQTIDIDQLPPSVRSINRKIHQNLGISENSTADEVIQAYNLHEFCYNSLKIATNRFSKKNLLGVGGCGEVYKGWINYSTMKPTTPHGEYPIAVKKYKDSSGRAREEWLSEVKFLSRFDHPNIVKLIGYCSEVNHRILVYEYMSKGSLEANLLKGLNWNSRLKVALGSAKGLECLHTIGSVIHRDIKSSNILLDNDFNPKISDFGLAKFGPRGDKTHVTTRVLGTKRLLCSRVQIYRSLDAKNRCIQFWGSATRDIIWLRCSLRRR